MFKKLRFWFKKLYYCGLFLQVSLMRRKHFFSQKIQCIKYNKILLFPTNTQKFWHIEKSWFVFQFRRPCAFLSIEDTTRSMRSTCCWPSSSLVRHAFRLETEKKALHNRAGHMYIRYTFLKKISTFLKDIVCPLLLGFRPFKSNSFYEKQLISKDLNPQKIKV